MAREREPRKPKARRRRWLTHRGFVAVEALLLAGILKDLAEDFVKASELGPRWKVLFVMAFTVGLFGSLFFFVERFTARAVAGGHRLERTLPLAMPFWVAHAAILLALFFLYAHYLGIRVL
jgi:hypothetical protein